MSSPRSIFNEHFGAIITAVASLSAVLVSLAQVWVASINKEKELSVVQATAQATRDLEELKASRSWKLDLAKFMAEHRKVIFSENAESREIRQIMLATFPPEVTFSVFGSLSKISEGDSSAYWAAAEDSAKQLYAPRVKIYYEESFPRGIIDIIGDTLAGGDIDYDYYDQQIPQGLTDGDVRYFHPSDEELAARVKQDFILHSCYEGYTLHLKTVPLTLSQKRAPRGTIELWLPGKAIVGEVNPAEC